MSYSSQDNDIRKIGDWVLGRGLRLHGKGGEGGKGEDGNNMTSEDLAQLFKDDGLEPITLIVVTKEERPYVMLKPGFAGNDAYDGFAIDLLKVTLNAAVPC